MQPFAPRLGYVGRDGSVRTIFDRSPVTTSRHRLVATILVLFPVLMFNKSPVCTLARLTRINDSMNTMFDTYFARLHAHPTSPLYSYRSRSG
jgi:hypothetical protein